MEVSLGLVVGPDEKASLGAGKTAGLVWKVQSEMLDLKL